MAEQHNLTGDSTLSYLFNRVWDKLYPVGAIYMSMNSTSPEKLFGGKWERITGRFLLGATDGGATNTNANASQAPGSMAGEAAHTLAVSEMPSHTHQVQNASGNTLCATGSPAASDGPSWCFTDVNDGPAGDGTSGKFFGGSVGGSGSHNNMPPFLAVYMWKRTA